MPSHLAVKLQIYELQTSANQSADNDKACFSSLDAILCHAQTFLTVEVEYQPFLSAKTKAARQWTQVYRHASGMMEVITKVFIMCTLNSGCTIPILQTALLIAQNLPLRNNYLTVQQSQMGRKPLSVGAFSMKKVFFYPNNVSAAILSCYELTWTHCACSFFFFFLFFFFFSQGHFNM